MADNLYTCIGCGEKLSNEVLVCSKCGRKTLAGKKADFDKKWNTPEAKAKVKQESNQEFMGMIVVSVISLTVIIGGCVAFIKDASKERPKSAEDIKIEKLRFCEDVIKSNLKDPSSYRRINSRDRQIATGYIRYSATNSFGARVQEVFECFDP
tara:strand:+ start:36 stop:494 length:459 start_codon:yes stop_codon:yes gene_type:complete